MDDLPQPQRALDVGIPEFGMIQAGAGQVRQQHTKGDADQKKRLVLFHDAHVKQYAGQGDHDDLPHVHQLHKTGGGPQSA